MKFLSGVCGAMVAAVAIAPDDGNLSNCLAWAGTPATSAGDRPAPHDAWRARAGDGGPVIAQAKVNSPAEGGATDVVWTSLVNVTTSGNSLHKAGGCDGCPDAGAVSEQQITSGSGYMQFTASETTTLRAIGLSAGNPGTTPTEIRFAVILQPGGIAEVRESGRYRTDTPFVTGDVFRIAVQSGMGSPVVRYYKNGKLIYRSTVAPEYPLLVAASLLSLHSTISKVMLHKAP
jgi:hypothetical protein